MAIVVNSRAVCNLCCLWTDHRSCWTKRSGRPSQLAVTSGDPTAAPPSLLPLPHSPEHSHILSLPGLPAPGHRLWLPACRCGGSDCTCATGSIRLSNRSRILDPICWYGPAARTDPKWQFALNRETQYRPLKCYNPYYRDPQNKKRNLIFGNPEISINLQTSTYL